MTEYFLTKIEVLNYFLMQEHTLLFEVISVFDISRLSWLLKAYNLTPL